MAKTVFDKLRQRLRVLGRPCETCIFKPGNRMSLRPGQRDQMVAQCLEKDSYIICHDTLAPRIRAAVCRGFFNRHARDVLPLRLAIALGIVEHVDPPPSRLAPPVAAQEETR